MYLECVSCFVLINRYWGIVAVLGSFPKQERKKKKKKREGRGWGFRGVEERGYWGGQDRILITLDRHECFSVFHHLQKDKQRKQRHSLCEARYEKTREFQTQLLHYFSKSDNKSHHHYKYARTQIFINKMTITWILFIHNQIYEQTNLFLKKRYHSLSKIKFCTQWYIDSPKLLLCLCVLFYSSFVYTCVCVFLHIQSPLRECRSIRSGASGLPYYCAPLVCVSEVIQLLTVWRDNKPKTKKTWTHWRKSSQTSTNLVQSTS